MIKFIFDLDGTLTKAESLPLIARQFEIEAEIGSMTQEAIHGATPYSDSLHARLKILGGLPVDEVALLLSDIPLYPRILQFIGTHKKDCVVATSNVFPWIERLIPKIGCEVCCSSAKVENNAIIEVTEILQKDAIVKRWQVAGYKVVFIGEGQNDFTAMMAADISIATALTHPPAKSIISIADYIFFKEENLCEQLEFLYLAG